MTFISAHRRLELKSDRRENNSHHPLHSALAPVLRRFPPLQILKETVKVDELSPFERLQQQTVDVPMPQILKETVEVTEHVAPASAVTNTVIALVI